MVCKLHGTAQLLGQSWSRIDNRLVYYQLSRRD